jgi:glycosyltransferase involved in cell wall biosynthesis
MGDRVVFCLPSFVAGGAERVMAQVATHFAAQGFDTHFVVLSGEGPNRQCIGGGVRVHLVGAARLRDAFLAFPLTVRTLRPRVLVSTLPHVNILLALTRPLWGSGVLLILRESSVLSRTIRLEHPRSRRTWMMAARSAYGRADAVIALTEEASADLRESFGVRPERIHLLPNPLDLTGLRARTSSIGFSRKDHILTPPRRWVSVGRLDVTKGYDGLMEALAAIPPEARSGLRWDIHGDGPMRSELASLASRLGLGGVVTFRGYSDDVVPVLLEADLFVMPSRHEGMPSSLLEALALEVPVLASDFAAARDLLGSAATLLPNGDKGKWPGILRRVLENTPGPASVDLSRFDAPKVFGEYERVVRDALERRGSEVR